MKNYNNNFIELLDNVEDHEYIGLGNPNSNILIVGKEAAIDIDVNENFDQIKEKLIKYHGSQFNWKSEMYDYTHNPNQLSKLSDTWQNYQQLYNNIYTEKQDKLNATFLKDVFTTEMSNLPSKTTCRAKKNIYFKNELQLRKDNFFKSEFIQSFPVVVLACSDYITNNDTKREIDEIFDVQFSGEYKEYSKGNWIYLHYNETKTRLVIHTRQLSSNINNELLNDLGVKIKEHLKYMDLQ